MQATLLVVESDRESGQVLSMYLEQQSYQVVLVEDLEKAKGILGNVSISAILADLDEPEAGWSAFYSWLRQSEEYKELPCVWIASQFNEITKAFSEGPHDHLLQKPLDPDIFLDVIATHTKTETPDVSLVATNNNPPFQGLVSPDDPLVDAWVDSLRGRMIGSVVLEKEIGRGGMGVVFQGSQTSLHRKVAVKIMLPHLTKKLSTVERFQREALGTAKLKSPHIVQIFEAGTTDDQLFFIVMEWLEGQTLEAKVQKEKRLSPLFALEVIMQTTNGLVVAHEAGLIHRDLKPSNLIVGSNGHISITDFGLVYNQHTPRHTQSGIVVGTPHYLSPEQASGQSIDARSDIYALGILFFELLTGRVPFASNNLTELLIAHVQAPLPDPHDLVADLPDNFVPVLQKMTAKDPAQRYQSASQLYQTLQRLALTGKNAPTPSPAFELPSAAMDRNDMPVTWEPEPLGKDKDLLRTQVISPMASATPNHSSPNIPTGDLSHNEFFKHASALTPSSLTPSSPHWNALQVQGMMMVDYQGNLVMQEGAVQAHWHSALAVLLGHSEQIESAVSLGAWEYTVLETAYAALFLLPKDNHIMAIVRPPRESNTPSQTPPSSPSVDPGATFSRMIQSLHALSGVSNILLYDLAVQLMDARLGHEIDPHDYPLKMSPIIHMLQAIPWEQASLHSKFSEGHMRFWPMNGAFLCVQTTAQCNQSLLSMMVQRQSAAVASSTTNMVMSGMRATPSHASFTPMHSDATYAPGANSFPGHTSNQGMAQGHLHQSVMQSQVSQPMLHPPSGPSFRPPNHTVSQEFSPSAPHSVPGYTPTPSGATPVLNKSSLAMVPVSVNNPHDCLLSGTVQELTQLFTKYAGPIGKIVVSKTIKKMGFGPNQFPKELTPQLLEQLAHRIKGKKKTEFVAQSKSLMAQKTGNVHS